MTYRYSDGTKIRYSKKNAKYISYATIGKETDLPKIHTLVKALKNVNDKEYHTLVKAESLYLNAARKAGNAVLAGKMKSTLKRTKKVKRYNTVRKMI